MVGNVPAVLKIEVVSEEYPAYLCNTAAVGGAECNTGVEVEANVGNALEIGIMGNMTMDSLKELEPRKNSTAR